jgi:hypothetical protein
VTDQQADQFARDRIFWLRMGRAVIIGGLAGVAALAFTQIVRIGTELIWPDDVDYGWLGGELWWLAILGVAGLIVGVLRMSLRVPDDLRGSLGIIQEGAFDRSMTLQAIGISIVSLVGGASLPPRRGHRRHEHAPHPG